MEVRNWMRGERVMEDQSVERRPIGMYHEEWMVVDALANALARKNGGKPNVSAAMRVIIRERETLRDPRRSKREAQLKALARGYLSGKVLAEEFAQQASLLMLDLVEPDVLAAGGQTDGKDEIPGNSAG